MTIVHSALLTDLYQLTMLQTYHAERMNETAVFELFVRRLPPERNFSAGCRPGTGAGLSGEPAFHRRRTGLADGRRPLQPEFVASLANFRFTGAVHALPEGWCSLPTNRCCGSPPPLPQAQLVESRLINLLHYQTLIASKAPAACWPRPASCWWISACAAPTAARQRCWPRGPLIWLIRRYRHRAGRDAVRHSAVRHHGPLADSGPRPRGRRLSNASPPPSPAT